MNPTASRLPRRLYALSATLLALVTTLCVLLWPEWRHNPDLSHGFFAPFIFLLLVWESRRSGPPRWVPAGRYLPELTLVFALGAGFALFGLAGIFSASLACDFSSVGCEHRSPKKQKLLSSVLPSRANAASAASPS